MKVHLVNLGCPKNLVDGEVMAGYILQGGHTLSGQPESADVVVVNTCGFIRAAKEESLDAVMEAVRLKGERPSLRVVAAGCLAQRYLDDLRAEIPEVDAFLGVDDIPDIAGVLGQLESRDRQGHPVQPGAEPSGTGDGPRPTATAKARFLYRHDSPRAQLTPRHCAYVKISEGCPHRCTFCAIPGIRGPFRSRQAQDIQQEIRDLVLRGVREIVLVGQDTTAYGRDLSESVGLSGLLRLADAVPGDFRIRVMYAYPSEVDGGLLEAVASSQKVCRYIDVPFQHSHPDILKAMGRPGCGDSYLRLLETIRGGVPDASVRTSLIAGFPGETEAHFRHLLDFVREAKFDHLGVFAYSDEDGTPAFLLPGKVGESAAERRRGRLMRAQQSILRRKAGEHVGRVRRVLVDGVSPEAEHLIQGRTDFQAPEVDGVTYLVDGPLETVRRGEFVYARIVKQAGYDLVATVEEKAT